MTGEPFCVLHSVRPGVTHCSFDTGQSALAPPTKSNTIAWACLPFGGQVRSGNGRIVFSIVLGGDCSSAPMCLHAECKF